MEAMKHGGTVFKAGACGTLGMLMMYAARVDAVLFFDTCLEHAPDDKFQTMVADAAVDLLHHRQPQVSLKSLCMRLRPSNCPSNLCTRLDASDAKAVCELFAHIPELEVSCACIAVCIFRVCEQRGRVRSYQKCLLIGFSWQACATEPRMAHRVPKQKKRWF
jgi:hypothetical protein